MPYTTKRAITISFDLDALKSYSDAFLAQLWHVAQANPAPISDLDAGDTAEHVGREIIRRWLERTTPELWAHQGRHAYSCVLSDNGHWVGPARDRWIYGKPEETADQVGARAAAGFAAAKAPA